MKRSKLGSERAFQHDHSILDVFYLKFFIKLSFQNSYVKQMLTATKRGLVLTKSVNAFQDGIHRRIVKVSAKNQLYLMEA